MRLVSVSNLPIWWSWLLQQHSYNLPQPTLTTHPSPLDQIAYVRVLDHFVYIIYYPADNFPSTTPFPHPLLSYQGELSSAGLMLVCAGFVLVWLCYQWNVLSVLLNNFITVSMVSEEGWLMQLKELAKMRRKSFVPF